MKKILYSLFSFFLLTTFLGAQTTVTLSSSFEFTPADITISVGETVEWNNTSGTHNVNGSLATYPNNPEGFFSGIAAAAPWTFSHTFNTPGFYNYQCDPHVGLGMTGTITVEAPVQTNAMLITGVYDAQPAAAGAKGIEFYVLEDIPDLSIFGVGAANNGGGTDSIEFTFPNVSASAGDCIYVADDSTKFADFFGFNADYTGSSAAFINGDDAIELFENAVVIDVFGDINVDGSGEPWDYTDGWAYRKDATGPDGSTFVLDNWTYSGVDALQDIPTNDDATNPFPVCSYSTVAPTALEAVDDNYALEFNEVGNFNVLSNDILPNGWDTVYIHTNASNGMAMIMMDSIANYTPTMDYCGDDSFTYIVCDNSACDTATVSVTIDCPTSYPQYSISDVNTVDSEGIADSIDIACELGGIIYGTNLRPPNGLTHAIIDKDDPNEGIGLFKNSDNFGLTLNEGDSVIVQGVITQFAGLTQIEPDTMWVVSTGNDLHDPTVVTSLSEDTESNLIKMENMTFVDVVTDWDPSGSGMDIRITDGVDTFNMRIDNDVDLFSMPAPTFTNFNVTGLGGQFDFNAPHLEGYQIVPRYMEDLEEIVNVINPEIATKVEFFPNPVSETLTIKSEISIDIIQISNVLGQKVLNINKPENIEELNVSNLSPGIYVITFVSENQIWSAEFVKQ